MKYSRVKAIAKKELLQVLRDPMSLAMAFLMPAVLLIIFGYAITFDIRNINLVVRDGDRSALSRSYVSAFVESGYFSVVGYVENDDDIDDFLNRGTAKAALLIPAGFTNVLGRNGSVQVAGLVDGSDSNTATIALGYLTAVNESFVRKRRGGAGVPPIEVRSRVWYNPELKSRNFIVPGLIAVVMAIIISLLTSLTISKEWERGTMEQLISTPVKTSELILGKLAPYFLIGFIDTVVSALMGVLLFGVEIRGSVALLLSLSSVFLFGGLSFGILLSIVGRTQILSSQLAMFSTYLPVFLLSGFIFAISNMPVVLQAVTYAMPARYFVTIVKGIFLKGNPLRLLLLEATLLVVYGIVVFVAANRAFRKKVL